MNRHDFQQAAKKFRAGRLTLEDFANLALPSKADISENEKGSRSKLVPTPLPSRPDNAHKGDFGRVLVIGGSDSMSGAIKLTAMAALRSGSGLVTVATPESEQLSVESFSPCYMTVGFVESKGRFAKGAIDDLIEKCRWADVVAIGPGMSTSKSLQRLMKTVYCDLPQPVVVDADGLNNLAAAEVDLSVHEGQRVLTPHPGEFLRLINKEITDRKELETTAVELAKNSDVTVVLKGHQTLVADGSNSFRNQTGNPGMATAGSGDVLTGVIASFIGQGMSPFDGACAGVHYHGRAGDLGAARVGQVSLIASDILAHLSDSIMGS